MHTFYLKEVSSDIQKRGSFREHDERRYLITALRTNTLPVDKCCPGEILTLEQVVNIIGNGFRVIIEPEKRHSSCGSRKSTTLHLAPGYQVKKEKA